MLEVENLDAFYGQIHVLHGVNLSVKAGEIVDAGISAIVKQKA